MSNHKLMEQSGIQPGVHILSPAVGPTDSLGIHRLATAKTTNPPHIPTTHTHRISVCSLLFPNLSFLYVHIRPSTTGVLCWLRCCRTSQFNWQWAQKVTIAAGLSKINPQETTWGKTDVDPAWITHPTNSLQTTHRLTQSGSASVCRCSITSVWLFFSFMQWSLLHTPWKQRISSHTSREMCADRHTLTQVLKTVWTAAETAVYASMFVEEEEDSGHNLPVIYQYQFRRDDS